MTERDEVTEAGAERTATRRRLAQALDALSQVQMELDEERLHREHAEALLDQLLGAMSDAVLVVDARGRVTRANDAAGRMFGRPPEALTDVEPDGLFVGAVPSTPWELLSEGGPGSAGVDVDAERSDGTRIPVNLSTGVIHGPDGKILGAVYAARDLTEVHHLLREVESAEARWRLLAEVGELFAATPEAEHALDDVARRVVRATGGELAVVLLEDGIIGSAVAAGGDSLRELTYRIGGVAPGGSALARVLDGGETVHAARAPEGYPVVGIPEVDGALRSAAVVPLATEGESVGAAVLAAPDPDAIGEREVRLVEEVASRVALTIVNARLHDALLEQRAEVEASRFRDEILAAVTHDMKTPLSIVLGLVDTLTHGAGEVSGEERARILSTLDRQVRRMRRLVIQFLDYVRVEAGHELSISTRPVRVAPFIEKVMSSFQEGGRLESEIPEGLPPVVADPSRLDLALANLLTNALKYSPPGTLVTVTAERRGAQVEIAVVDRGSGIAPADQPHIFDRFSRSGPDGPEGTGLGLYMTRELMRSQGGDVRVASRPGRGSRFTLLLPVADTDGG